MAISFLQQQALGNAPDFNAQTNAIVQQQALIKANNYDEGGVAHPEDLDTQRQNILATVARSPATYGFVTTMLADAGWSLTYDAWSSNLPAAEGPILSGVQHWFNFLTGFTPMPPPPEPEPEPEP